MVRLRDRVIVTCEHGGNRVPAPYARYFTGWERRLGTHRGFDAGALRMAQDLARSLRAPLVASRVTRLLVDLNRSIGHRSVHSSAVRSAPAVEIERIVRDYYLPYRRRVEGLVRAAVLRGRRVVHVSSHSFAPRLFGEVRRADVGLLYDPSRPGERLLCERWKASLEALEPEFAVRRNYPYAGKNDGLTTDLRRRYSPRDYVGIELEVNQARILGAGGRWTTLRKTIVESLRPLVDPSPDSRAT